jgi:hypothetical protein
VTGSEEIKQEENVSKTSRKFGNATRVTVRVVDEQKLRLVLSTELVNEEETRTPQQLGSSAVG